MVGEIDPTVVLEVGMQNDVHEPLQTPGPDFRHAGNGFSIQHAVADYSQVAAPFSHEHCAIGQEGDRPGLT